MKYNRLRVYSTGTSVSIWKYCPCSINMFIQVDSSPLRISVMNVNTTNPWGWNNYQNTFKQPQTSTCPPIFTATHCLMTSNVHFSCLLFLCFIEGVNAPKEQVSFSRSSHRNYRQSSDVLTDETKNNYVLRGMCSFVWLPDCGEHLLMACVSQGDCNLA